MAFLKKRTLKGWRTFIINALMAIMPILELSELTAIIPEGVLPWYALWMAIVNMYLRTITTTPPGAKY